MLFSSLCLRCCRYILIGIWTINTSTAWAFHHNNIQRILWGLYIAFCWLFATFFMQNCHLIKELAFWQGWPATPDLVRRLLLSKHFFKASFNFLTVFVIMQLNKRKQNNITHIDLGAGGTRPQFSQICI